MNALLYARQIKNVSGSEKCVLMLLASHVNKRHRTYCYPSPRLIIEESCLSKATVHRCLNSLVDKGILTIVPKGKGRREYHFAKMDESHGETVQSHSETVESHSDTPITTKEHTIEHQSDSAARSFEEHSTLSISEEPVKSSDVMAGVRKKPTLDDIREKYSGVATPRKLGYLYRDLLAYFYPSMGMIVPLTLKQESNLKKICKDVPDFHEKLIQVVGAWVSFTKKCEKEFGAFKSPLRPEIGYLLKFRQAMVDFEADIGPTPTQPTSAPQKTPENASERPEEDSPITLEEILALEEEDEQSK